MEPMMISPNCPEHARLVLDLALGRLDDGSAAEAEVARETCPVCRTWWQAELCGEQTALVDDAVASVFDDLELPDRRRGHGRLALAAAAVMAVGAATLWLVQSPATQSPRTVEPVVVERMAAIASMDFEAPSVVLAHTESSSEPAAEIASADPAPAPAELEFTVNDEIVVANTAPDETGVAQRAEPLFAGQFETGDLSEWGPST